MTIRREPIIVEKRSGALHAVSNAAASALAKIKDKQRVAINIVRSRSVEQNSMYWTILDRAVEATGKWRTAEELHSALKVATGHVDRVLLLDGRLVLCPGSIAFDKMGQEEAQRYYDAALRVVAEEIMDCSVEDLLAA